MKSIVKLFVAASLLLLFTYAAASKLADLPLFRAQLYLQPFPHGITDLLVFSVPAAELIAVILLFADRTRFAGFLLSAVLLMFFTGYIAVILIYRQGKLPCSCGGILNHLSWPAHLVFNCFFLSAALAGIATHRRKTGTAPGNISSSSNRVSRKPAKRVGILFI